MIRGRGHRCVVRYIVMCFILGGYETATTIAPPRLRYDIYGCKDDVAFVDKLLLSQLNSRELYSIISEFIVCMSRRHSALYHALGYMTQWYKYETTCLRVCNELLRRRVYTCAAYTKETSPMPTLSRTYYKHHRIGQLHDNTSKMRVGSLLQLCSIMNVRYRIPPAIIHKVGGPKQARVLYKIAVAAENSCAIQASVLIRMGVDSSKVEIFKQSIQGCDVKHTKRKLIDTYYCQYTYNICVL